VDRLLCKPEEAAELLGIGRSKFYELIAAGIVDSVRIGGCRRIPLAALEEYVERLREGDDDDPYRPGRAA
jgi:excisionase family DNA binding protein